MSAWLPIGGVPPELRGATLGHWLRHPGVVFRATLLLATIDIVATCRHVRRHPDPPDVPALASTSPPPVAAAPILARHPTPTSPDPRGGVFTLAAALDGLPCTSAPVAEIETSVGALRCELWPDRAPVSVANFIGLARGLREFWDATSGSWVRRPFYDGTVFHWVQPGRWIQAGDPLRTGDGDPGVTFPDENTAPHDRAGLLCMANRASNENHGQFIILALPRPVLDGHYSVFGRCSPAALVDAISEFPANNGTPMIPVVVRRVRVGCGA